MNKKIIIAKQKKLIIFFTIVVAIVLSLIRAFFGADLTDEALYIAEPFIVIQGATPYVSDWFQSAGFALISSPVIRLFLSFNSSTSGIVLFTRIAFVVFKFMVCLIAFLLIKKHFTSEISILFLLPIFLISPHSIANFSYNTLSLFFLFLENILIFSSFMEKNSIKKIFYSLFSGILSALCAFIYPSQIIQCVIMLIIILYISIVFRRKSFFVLSYIAGGLMTATVLIAYLSVQAGGTDGLMYCLNSMINKSAYAELVNYNVFALLRDHLFKTLTDLKIFFIFLIFTILLICYSNQKKTSGNNRIFNSENIVLYLFVFSTFCLIITFIFYCRDKIFNSYIYLIVSFFIIPFLLFFVKLEKQKFQLIFIIIWISSACSTLIAGFSYGGIINRYYFLIAGSSLIILFAQPFLFKNIQLNALPKYYFPRIFCLILSLFSVFGYYGYIYREDILPKLNHKIEYGAYSGIYTTSEKALAIIEVEKNIRNLTTAEDTVLFMDWVPFGYFMTDAKACAPSTTDMMAYTYGMNSPQIMYDYFQFINKIPDKIIYVNFGRDKQLSIEDTDYLFNSFVNNNYTFFQKIHGKYYLFAYEIK